MANVGYAFSGTGAVPSGLTVTEGAASVIDGVLTGEGEARVQYTGADYANGFVAMRLVALASKIECALRIAAAGETKYFCEVATGGTVRIWKSLSGSGSSTLETITSVTQDAGDMFALQAFTVGSNVHLRAWRKASGGAWAPLGTGVTDSSSPITAAGDVDVYLDAVGDTIDKLEIYDVLATGNTFPSSGTSVDRAGLTAWTTPGNIVSDNGSDATCNATGSDYLVGSDFAWTDLPSGGAVLGVTARVEASEHSGGDETLSVQLQDASAALVGSAKTVLLSGTTKAIYTLGGVSDLWGAALTPAMVNDSDFGCRSWFTTAHDVRVDYVTLNVVYIGALSAALPITSDADGAASTAVAANRSRATTASGAGVATSSVSRSVVRSVVVDADGAATTTASMNRARASLVNVTGSSSVDLTLVVAHYRSATAASNGVANIALTLNAVHAGISSPAGTGTASVSLNVVRAGTADADGVATTAVSLNAAKARTADATGTAAAAISANRARSADAIVAGAGVVVLTMNTTRSVVTDADGSATAVVSANAVKARTADVVGLGVSTATLARVLAGQTVSASGLGLSVVLANAVRSRTADVIGTSIAASVANLLRGVSLSVGATSSTTVELDIIRSAIANVSGQGTADVVLNASRLLSLSAGGQALAAADLALLVLADTRSGKYEKEHASALAAMQGATGFSDTHASAKNAVRGVGDFANAHRSAASSIRKAG